MSSRTDPFALAALLATTGTAHFVVPRRFEVPLVLWGLRVARGSRRVP